MHLLRFRFGFFLLLRGCRVFVLVIFLVNVHAFVKLFQQVGSDVLIHAEHGNTRVASHDGLKLGIAEDFSLVVGVLQIVGPNIHPQGLSDLRARENVLPTNIGQRWRQTVRGLLSRRSLLLLPLLPGGSLAFFGRARVFGQINRGVGVDVRSDVLVHRELKSIEKMHPFNNETLCDTCLQRRELRTSHVVAT